MPVPSVNVSITDRGLGLVPATDRSLTVIGPTSDGVANLLTTVSSVQELTDTFGEHGSAVEAAALAIGIYGLTAHVIKTEASTVGTHGTLDADTGFSLSSSQPTVVADADVIVEITKAGTVGASSAIQYEVSTDGGNTWGRTLALGSATAVVVAGLASFDVTGSLPLGAQARLVVHAPQSTAADLQPALDLLAANNAFLPLTYIATPATAAVLGAVESSFTLQRAKNRPRTYIISARTPLVDTGSVETNAAYLAAMTALRASFSTKQGSVCAGAIFQVSAVDRSDARAPWGASFAAFRASLSPEQNTAALRHGPLPGARLKDSTGSSIPGIHDEYEIGSSLSDLGLCVARSFPGYAGARVNLESIASDPGSDYELVTRSLIRDLAHSNLYQFFAYVLAEPLPVNAKGQIVDHVAHDLEENSVASLVAQLGSTPRMISSATVVITRTTNVFATGKLAVKARIQPLFYPGEIDIDLGYEAVQTVQAA